MTIINNVVFTQYSPEHRASVERTVSLDRPYKLTDAGAQRIIRADGYEGAIVSRVETMIYARSR